MSRSTARVIFRQNPTMLTLLVGEPTRSNSLILDPKLASHKVTEDVSIRDVGGGAIQGILASCKLAYLEHLLFNW